MTAGVLSIVSASASPAISYMRRPPKVSEVLSILYLRGLSTDDFRPALETLLGEDAAGLSPTTIARLTAGREKEYADFRQRDLSGRERQLNGAVLLLLARTVVKLAAFRSARAMLLNQATTRQGSRLIMRGPIHDI
jgi:Transposase, Mutator family